MSGPCGTPSSPCRYGHKCKLSTPPFLDLASKICLKDKCCFRNYWQTSTLSWVLILALRSKDTAKSYWHRGPAPPPLWSRNYEIASVTIPAPSSPCSSPSPPPAAAVISPGASGLSFWCLSREEGPCNLQQQQPRPLQPPQHEQRNPNRGVQKETPIQGRRIQPRPHLHHRQAHCHGLPGRKGRTVEYHPTLQSVMNAKRSQQRFWHRYENGLI